MNLFARVTLLFLILLLFQSESHGQVNADSLWSFSTIRSDTDGDSVLDYKGYEVTTSGIINIDSGLLHESYLQTFIQNDSTGMSIFGMRIDTPVAAGDSIIVRGTIDRYYGLAEVRVDSYEVFPNVRQPIPKPLTDAVENPAPFIGMLIQGEGVITGLGTIFNGKYFMLSPDESDSELMIYVSNFHRMYSEFNFDVLSAGDRVSVKGVMSEHSPDFPDNRTHKLFLSTPDDLQYLGLPVYYVRLIFGGAVVFGLIILVWVLILRKRVDSKTKKIQLSLKQKELLLKEIHHRVKNSLSIVSGLIEIQRSSTENREADYVLQDSQNRIQSIALIHDKLYKTESLSDIDLDLYIKDLVESIHGTFTEYNDAVTLQFDLDTIKLDTDRAVYCGLLLNELIVNAYKYAFNKNTQGKLSITLKKLDKKLLLKVSDNGPGLPVDFNPQNEDSLGTMLINSFATQLNAEMEISESPGGGTSFEFRIPYQVNGT
ncbi:sensor histidine kinase [Rhodohalobacter sp. SW132]|uniref:sensor histidine kinase n=1 Tax=Rhodohalobacter sp. SW132 TaxID=2293433 RepID=UPI001315ACDF|nr:sensor histidine kinase [Rhodohalobacter sp. SW132]